MKESKFIEILAKLEAEFGPENCWPWPYGLTSRGYGNCSINGVVNIYTHRKSLELKLGR